MFPRKCPGDGNCNFKGVCSKGNCLCISGHFGNQCQCKPSMTYIVSYHCFNSFKSVDTTCPGSDGNCNNGGSCDIFRGDCQCNETFFGPACECEYWFKIYPFLVLTYTFS